MYILYIVHVHRMWIFLHTKWINDFIHKVNDSFSFSLRFFFFQKVWYLKIADHVDNDVRVHIEGVPISFILLHSLRIKFSFSFYFFIFFLWVQNTIVHFLFLCSFHAIETVFLSPKQALMPNNKRNNEKDVEQQQPEPK